MKIKFMLDKRKFSKKPETDSEIKGVQYRLSIAEMDIKELAQGLSNGMSFRPGVCVGGKKAKHWSEQQLFALDFDDGMTPETALNICNKYKINPVFLYTSFSDSSIKRKFRMVFCTDDIITDGSTRDKLQLALMNLFGEIDPRCYNRDRLFYGGKGKSPIYCNDKARINADEIIEKYYKEEFEKKATKDTSSKHKNDNKNKKEKSPITKKISDDSYMINIEAIRNLDISKMRQLLSIKDEVVVVSNEAEMRQFIKSIDLTKFTGIEIGQKVNCILSGHADYEPSAAIYSRTEDGSMIYKCFGCGAAIGIVSLVEALTGLTRIKAEGFIKSVYGIEIHRSEWVEEQKEILKSNLQYLDGDDLKLEFPNLHRLIRTRAKHLKLLTGYFEQFIDEKVQLNGKPLFFAGYTKLCEVCGINPNKRLTLSQSLTLFVLLSMLVKVEPTNVPEKELKTAQTIAIQYGFKKLTNFYQFDELGYNQLAKSEKIAKNLIENNVSLKGISREYLLRTFGINVADRVYPQYKESNKSGTSNKSDKLTMEIASFILEEIQAKGYVTEKKIKVNERVKTQYKRSIQEILNTYGLAKIRANQANKDKYGLPNELCGQSSVIVKER